MGSRLGPSGHWHGHPRGRLAHQTAPRAARAKARLAEGYRAMRGVLVVVVVVVVAAHAECGF